MVHWSGAFLFGYLPALACVMWPPPLFDRPQAFSRWPLWSQRTYTIGWSLALAIMWFVAMSWAYLVWVRA
jgi:hypothetical protein